MQTSFLDEVDRPPVQEVNGLYPAKCQHCEAYIKVCNWGDDKQECCHCHKWGKKHDMVRVAVGEGAEIIELSIEIDLPWIKNDPFVRQQHFVALGGEVVSQVKGWERILCMRI